MTTSISTSVAVLLLVFCVHASADQIPPGESGAKTRLEKSPRHGEWVDVVSEQRRPPLRCYVVYPQTRDNAPVVIVIHEIYGLTDWIRAVADQLAADGFIAVAPDFLSGMGPGGGGTEAFESRDDVVKAVRSLTPDDVGMALDAVKSYGEGQAASSGKTATIGFCWGGMMSFHYATSQPALGAAVVYYGTSPSDESALARINAPVLGLYGSDDARVNKTIEPAERAMNELGKSFTHHMYEGAGHGFLRQQEGRDGANQRAAEQAWAVTIEFLREHMK